MGYVVGFHEGGREATALLGGKGAHLGELTRLGVAVPPGFVVTTAASRAYAASGEIPGGLMDEIRFALTGVGAVLGRAFGDPQQPLLVSVRSGAPTSMPGMMDTILNVGVGPTTVAGLARQFGSPSLAQDCYARLIHSFGTTVRGLSTEQLQASDDPEQTVAVRLEAYAKATGEPFPDDPWVQLRQSVAAVIESWNSPRARAYRRFRKLADTGTAVVVQAMVFGNAGPRSGTGVLFTRNPSTGAPELFGDYLADAQGEDIVAGTHNAADLGEMSRLVPDAHAELTATARAIEAHYRDMCEIEFTVERGELWILQTRIGQRSAPAAVRIAFELARDGVIDASEAIARVDARALEDELRPHLDLDRLDPHRVLTTGIGASPGLVTGPVVFDSRAAIGRREAGEAVILARRETRPEDFDGILAAEALLTTRGGKTSHAAVVTRGLGRCCVCGAEEIEISEFGRYLRIGAVTVNEGDVLSVDGDGGLVILGPVPVLSPRQPEGLDELLEWADQLRDLAVDALVTSVAEIDLAPASGADGVILQLSPAHALPDADTPRPASVGTSRSVRRELSVAGWVAALDLSRAADRGWMAGLATQLRQQPAWLTHLIVPAAQVAPAHELVLAAGAGTPVIAEASPGSAEIPEGAMVAWAVEQRPAPGIDSPPARWALVPSLDADDLRVARDLGASRIAVTLDRVASARLQLAQTASRPAAVGPLISP